MPQVNFKNQGLFEIKYKSEDYETIDLFVMNT